MCHLAQVLEGDRLVGVSVQRRELMLQLEVLVVLSWAPG